MPQKEHTFWRMEFMASFLTPANRVEIQSVCIYPEVVAVGVAIKVKLYPVPTNLKQVRPGKQLNKAKQQKLSICVHNAKKQCKSHLPPSW